MKNKFLIVFLLAFLVGCSAEEEIIDPKPPVLVEDKLVFNLVGIDYTLPVSFETFIHDGWVAVDSVEGSIEPHKYISNIYMRKDRNLISVSIHNNTDETILKSLGLVAVIEAENRTSVNGLDQPVDIRVHGDIDFGSGEEFIHSRFELVEETSNEVFNNMIIKHNKLSETEFRFNKETGVMRWIIIKNFK